MPDTSQYELKSLRSKIRIHRLAERRPALPRPIVRAVFHARLVTTTEYVRSARAATMECI